MSEKKEQAVDPVFDEVSRLLDVKFLENDDMKQVMEKQELTLEEFVSDFRRFAIEEVFMNRKETVLEKNVEKLQPICEFAYMGYWQREMESDAKSVKMRIAGISPPLNYIGGYKKASEAKFKEAKEKLAAGDNSYWKKGLAEKWFNEKGDPLERRKEKVGTKDYGKKFKVDSSYFANVLGMVIDSSGNKRFFSDIIGGEINDQIIRLACDKCGKESITMKCKECGYKKPFFDFEDICKVAFHEVSTKIRFTKNKNGADVIKWCNQTTIPKKKRFLTPKEVEEILSDPGIASRVVKATDLEKVCIDHPYKKDKSRVDPGYWIIFSGVVNDVNPYPDNRRKCPSIKIVQKGMAFAKDSTGKPIGSVKINIPNHVWEFMGGKYIANTAEIVVFGNPIRDEKFDFTSRKTLKGVYNAPEIMAWGFYLLSGGKPRDIIEDVVEDEESGVGSVSDEYADYQPGEETTVEMKTAGGSSDSEESIAGVAAGKSQPGGNTKEGVEDTEWWG